MFPIMASLYPTRYAASSEKFKLSYTIPRSKNRATSTFYPYVELSKIEVFMTQTLTSTFYPYVELSKIEVFMTQTLTSAFYPYVELSKIEVFMSQPPPSNETQPLEVIPCTYTYSDSLGISPDIVR
jgi:hypothetical protein